MPTLLLFSRICSSIFSEEVGHVGVLHRQFQFPSSLLPFFLFLKSSTQVPVFTQTVELGNPQISEHTSACLYWVGNMIHMMPLEASMHKLLEFFRNEKILSHPFLLLSLPLFFFPSFFASISTFLLLSFFNLVNEQFNHLVWKRHTFCLQDSCCYRTCFTHTHTILSKTMTL